MKLIKLVLENFQGIKKETLELKGKSASIYGDNATGKTTIFNAVTWLLYGKASTGAKNYTPKTKGPDGDLHHLDHAAEGTFKLEDGRIITLKKIYHETYRKKRGSSIEEFSGHTTDHFIDGVPATEKEYNETLTNLSGGDQEKMKMLTMPHYFPEEMEWADRRKILLEMSGDVTDDEVINSNEDLADLKDYLLMPGTVGQYYTVDEYKKIAGAQKTKINKQIQEIPGRIDEAERAIPDTKGLDEKAIDKTIKELKAQRSDLELEKAQALSGDLTSVAVRNQISEANARLAEARATHATKYSQLNENIYTAIAQLKKEQLKVRSTLQDNEASKYRTEVTITRLNNHRKQLLEEYMAIQKEAWDETKEECPTCHRGLPEEEIQDLKDKFNMQKSARLQGINEKGQKEASKDMIADLEKQSKTLGEAIRKHKATIEDFDQQIQALEEQIKSPPPFETTPDFLEISAEINKYRKEEEGSASQQEEIAKGYTDKIQALHQGIREQEEKKMQLKVAASQKERIKELEKMEERLAQEYEGIERGTYLCELFIKTKVNLLTDKINDRFESVTFRLFKEQQNGGVKEDCEVMIPSEGGRLVDYAYANNAARINAGLEIIAALADYWKLDMPVFIDNAESVTRLQDIETQVVRLVVSEPDKKLRLEVGA